MTIKQSCDQFLSVGQVAYIFRVNIETLRRWDKNNILKPIRMGTRNGVGDRKYTRSAILKFTEERIDKILKKG